MRSRKWTVTLFVLLLMLAIDVRAARADDCREVLAQTYLEEIDEALPAKVSAPRIAACEIDREGAELRVYVRMSVLVRLGFKRRVAGSVTMVLSGDCTTARVDRTSIPDMLLDLLSANWRERLTTAVVTRRDRPPLAQYCGR